ncbi:MAG: hypothetical protein E7324_09820 [Clostridiales bacterium]|nr:hypothetical protein [Clostridiales bacterium]
MIYSYCKKCKLESPGDTCRQCGKHASPGAQRNIWSIASVPVSDGRAWRGILMVLIIITALLMALIFGLESMVSGNAKVNLMWNGGLPQLILAILPLGLFLSFLVLTLQGREVIVYVMDGQGAHLQTWHPPARIKSWARLQSHDVSRDVPQPDGTVMRLSQERHMLWKDVQSVRYLPGRACILLYHTPHCAPMVLKLPPEEYDLAAAMVQKHCKGK